MVTSSPRTLLQFSMRKRTNSHTWRKRKIRYYYYYYNYYILNFLLALLQWLTGRFHVVQVRFCSSQHRGKTNTVAFTECLQIHNLNSEKMPKIFCFRPGQCPNNNMWQLWLAGNSRNIRNPSRLSLITTAFVFTRDPRALHSQEEWHEDDEFQPQSPFVGSFFFFFSSFTSSARFCNRPTASVFNGFYGCRWDLFSKQITILGWRRRLPEANTENGPNSWSHRVCICSCLWTVSITSEDRSWNGDEFVPDTVTENGIFKYFPGF